MKITKEQYNNLPEKYKAYFSKGGDLGSGEYEKSQELGINQIKERKNIHPT